MTKRNQRNFPFFSGNDIVAFHFICTTVLVDCYILNNIFTTIPRKRALLIVDLQYDFIPPNGSLAVPGGDKVVGKINEIRTKYGKKFDLVVCSKDWHPKNHCSFLSNNVERDPKAKLFAPCLMKDGKTMQMMWPDHCVQDSEGSKIHKDLIRKETDIIVKKGKNVNVDSYSAFMDNDKKSKTELEDILKKASITEIYCVGLAYDYCVGSTAVDGAAFFKSYVIKEASASVAKESEKEMEENFKKSGVEIIDIAFLEKLSDQTK